LLPSHVFVAAGSGGLQQESVLLCEQIRVVDQRRILRTWGHLDEATMLRIVEAIKAVLDI